MKVEELIQRVHYSNDSGVQSDDSRLTDAFIFNKLISARAMLLHQMASKKQLINNWNYQTLEVDVSDEIKISPKKYIYRSDKPIPKVISDLDNPLIKSVTSIDSSIVYSMTDWEKQRYKEYSKYAYNTHSFLIRYNHLYVYPRLPNRVIITAVFEDLIDVLSYDDCCYDILSTDFPIDDAKVDVLIEIVIKEISVGFRSTSQDLTSNSRDDNTNNNKRP